MLYGLVTVDIVCCRASCCCWFPMCLWSMLCQSTRLLLTSVRYVQWNHHVFTDFQRRIGLHPKPRSPGHLSSWVVWGSTLSSPSGVQAKVPAANAFLCIYNIWFGYFYAAFPGLADAGFDRSNLYYGLGKEGIFYISDLNELWQAAVRMNGLMKQSQISPGISHL